jgi:hypothetical protein
MTAASQAFIAPKNPLGPGKHGELLPLLEEGSSFLPVTMLTPRASEPLEQNHLDWT